MEIVGQNEHQPLVEFAEFKNVGASGWSAAEGRPAQGLDERAIETEIRRQIPSSEG